MKKPMPTSRRRASVTQAHRPDRARTAQKKRGAVQRAASQGFNRARFADSLGSITFGGRRDLFRALGFARDITPAMYRARYRRNAVAGRIVEAKPKATWRGGAEVVENDNPEQTPFEVAWEALERRLNIWAMLFRADVLAGLNRYAVVLLGAPGELDQPLIAMSAEALVYLTPFSEEDAKIDSFDTDSTSSRFGRPVFYTLSRIAPVGPSNAAAPNGRRVHYSRVLHVADGLLDDHVYGVPRLERIWNDLDNLEKVTGGGAEAFWKRADRGMVLDLDPMIQLKPDAVTGIVTELEALKEQVDEYEHALKRVLTTRGVKVTELGSDVADIGPSVRALMSLISAGSEIPQRILMGSEAAKLASTQDADNWDERILDRRSQFAGPQIVLPFVDRLVALGALPMPAGPVEVRWPEIKNMSDAQRADIADKWAGLNQKAGEIVVSGADIREKVLGLDPLPAPDPAAALSLQTRRERSSWTRTHDTADRFPRSV
jgi:hypothetical protein